MRPEGSINLNVILHEDRLVTKMLVILATEEPGDNMKKSQFGWQRDVGRDGDKAIPGTPFPVLIIILFIILFIVDNN